MSREWDVTEGHDPHIAGYALTALEQLAAGNVKGAGVEAERWANRQIDSLVGLGWMTERTLPACTSPRSNHGDGRGCDDDMCPRHGGF
jgi:hypothetical protein